jgi:signal transduction histidine kinase
LEGAPGRSVGRSSGILPSAADAYLVPLVAAWMGVGIAAIAVAITLRSVLQASERRAAFVSAVTHELRTPLTTLRMYADMLTSGMVPEESRSDYLATIALESQRLERLIENVLADARLERSPVRRRMIATTPRELLDKIEPRLQSRAEQSAMRLTVIVEPSVEEIELSTDPDAVEQILLNLVDNACKYAAGADDRRIEVSLGCPASTATGRRSTRRAIEMGVRDHGPGVAADVRRRLFRPFTKSAREAADSASGVGLGLSLARRMARRLGGDLRHDRRTTDGARFVLDLPTGG